MTLDVAGRDGTALAIVCRLQPELDVPLELAVYAKSHLGVNTLLLPWLSSSPSAGLPIDPGSRQDEVAASNIALSMRWAAVVSISGHLCRGLWLVHIRQAIIGTARRGSLAGGRPSICDGDVFVLVRRRLVSWSLRLWQSDLLLLLLNLNLTDSLIDRTLFGWR